MILHLVHDEKIINRTIAIFEDVAPKQNLFVVFTRHQLKHVNNQDNVILFKNFKKESELVLLTKEPTLVNGSEKILTP